MLPALIPYWPAKVYTLGPIPIDPWATLVCLGFVFGLEVGRARGVKLGMEPRDVVDGALFIVGMGFVVAHLFHVLAYNPHLMDEDPWILFKLWAGFSSTGGFIGAVIGSIIFFRWIRPRPYWRYADNVMFGFPFGYCLGRLGCFSVHDHIGRPTDFFLAVDFPVEAFGGPRHDLALYEALWVGSIALFFYVLYRRRPERPGGLFLALWCMLYPPVRFFLDFLRNEDLRNADVRWFGLTPAQYVAAFTFLVGVWLVVRLVRQSPETPEPSPS